MNLAPMTKTRCVPQARVLIALGLIAGLSACASQAGLGGQAWVPGPAGSSMAAPKAGDLKFDLAVCQKTAQSSQGQQVDSYSDPRYGAVNAMTAALARNEMGSDARQNGQRARMALCLLGRGWVQSK
jgi:hypothetical protein